MLNTTIRQKSQALLLAGLLAAGLLAVPARAQSIDRAAAQQIRAMMEQRDRDLKAAIKPLLDSPKRATAQQRKKVEDLINDPIDFREMGRRALGPFWKDLSAAQRNEFVDVFSTIVRSQSLADLDIYNSKVSYETISVVGDSAYVKTLTTYQDRQAAVEYILGRHDQAWWVYDLILDEVGTVEGYARSFQSVVRKKGFEALMKSLYKKRDKVAAKS